MIRRTHYTAVGLFVIGCSVLLVALILLLSKSTDQSDYQSYLTYIDQNVAGLNNDSAVRFNGVKVGLVDEITLDPNNPQHVKVSLRIKKGTPITTSTTATLMSMGITGLTYVSLRAQSADAPPLVGNPVATIPFSPSLFTQVSNVLPELTSNIKTISENLNRVFDEKNRAHLSSTLANLAVITQHLSDNTAQFNAIARHLESSLTHIDRASASLPSITRRVDHTLKQSEHAIGAVKQLMQQAEHTLQTGQYTLDSLHTQTLPQMNAAIAQANRVLNTLDMLTEQIKQNPARLIRGSTPPPLGPGEHR